MTRLTESDRAVITRARGLYEHLRAGDLRDRYGESDPAALLVSLSGELLYLLPALAAIAERAGGGKDDGGE